ncbi:protein ANTAGONIST OF LIKE HETEROCHROMATIN PROTEIN 1-like [Aphis craccivora]|uniref:Protein ANTAGONIST OF LIKE HETEROCHROMATIN PROTEIN 1-like n=1 Tax=Aphis craccivora TaxID=307492 RepID=A0A6G0Y4H4_APHCR|nr:protein ANTAGONIST OF LIKE HETEROCHROMATIN PROTEIN 1-like [Aphis craccivora]
MDKLHELNYKLDLSSESDSDEEMNELLLLYSLSKRNKSIWKSAYMKKRKSHGEFILTSEFSDKQFTNYFRLNRNQFNEVLIGCNAQKPIDPEEKLAVFLRYLASGDSYKSIAYSYRMGDRTVSKIVNEVALAVWDTMRPLYLPQPTIEMWKSVALEFEQQWQFPHCIGALDGKHVVIKKPPKSGTSFFNYKQTFSLVLMALVDANYKFISVDVGSMGRFSDANIFTSSVLAKKMNRQSLQIPPPEFLPVFEQPLPYVFVADEAFPLSENLMRPYPKRSVTFTSTTNSRMYFWYISIPFSRFSKPFEIKVESVDNVVKAACVLHNYLRKEMSISNNITDEIGEMPDTKLLPLANNNCRTGSNAFLVRQKYTDYFNTVGSVPWQMDSVARGNEIHPSGFSSVVEFGQFNLILRKTA